MSKSMKDSWKDTGSGLGHAFKGLGKTLIVTGKTGVDKAVDWAEMDDSRPVPQYQQYPQNGQPQYAQVPQYPQNGQPQYAQASQYPQNGQPQYVQVPQYPQQNAQAQYQPLQHQYQPPQQNVQSVPQQPQYSYAPPQQNAQQPQQPKYDYVPPERPARQNPIVNSEETD